MQKHKMTTFTNNKKGQYNNLIVHISVNNLPIRKCECCHNSSFVCKYVFVCANFIISIKVLDGML